MQMTATSIQAGFEPIPGYVLRNKLGVGGYGEVWLTDAPGGLKKAIKFVHGNIDEHRAANELKSLQRIRQVNHPFILSLERIEVIHGQLIIVTELAQGSLHDRFNEFREKGFAGITRERLLGYLRDAADGLDFICQQHDLQHLDVKPANLLLVADRVKVADFGLIKDIQSNSLSVMGGLTPTYAAPEMFDGRPGRFSDQYSLAIVYQELLTGTLPFRGRTTAQLANEHLNKAPNLEAIPLLERPILSKALSKKPQMRFGDCREFINALERIHFQASEADANALANPRVKPRPAQNNPSKLTHGQVGAQKAPDQPNDMAKRIRSVHEKAPCNTESVASVSREIISVDVLPALEELERAEPLDALEMNASSGMPQIATATIPHRKTLTIGIGGTGGETLLALRRRTMETDRNFASRIQRGFLLIDTDQRSIEKALDREIEERLSYESTIHIPLKSSQYYRQSTTSSFPQMSRRWVYNIPRSLKTEGVRPLGMLAFLDNAPTVFGALQDSIIEVAQSNGMEQCGEPIFVQIVSSAHGGTGSAISAEIGFLIRQLAAEFEIPISVELLLTCATPNGLASTELTTASAIACFSEISHYFATEGLRSPIGQIPVSRAINQPPFDHVSLIYGGQCGSSSDWDSAINQAADYLWSLMETTLGPRLALTRKADAQSAVHKPDISSTPWLSTVATRQVDVNTKTEPDVAASRLCLRVALPLLTALTEFLENRSAVENTSDPLDSKLSEKMDFFVGDMFRTNKWTAQAWVHQCMVCLFPKDENDVRNEPSSGESVVLTESVPIENVLTTDQKQELAIVCEQLALDPQLAMDLVTKLFLSTRSSLSEWIVRRWLTSPSAWAHLRHVLRFIAGKFSVNSNSLFVVAQKLSEKHDALLEQLYNGQLKASSGQEQKLDATALEARFHSMAAKMLERMAIHMSYLEDIWTKECSLFRKELSGWAEALANRLGFQLDNSPQSQAALSILSRMEGEGGINKQVRSNLHDMAMNRLSGVFETKDISMTLSDGRMTFENVFDSAMQLFSETQSTLKRAESETGKAVIQTGQEPAHTVQISNASLQTFGSTSTNPTSPDGGVKPDRRSLADEIDATRPYFVEFGGSVRNVVSLPCSVAEQLDPIQKIELSEKRVATLICDNSQRSLIICLGTGLCLSDIMDRIWIPSTGLWQLANRVVSRVDVDWNHIEK